jgi:TatD DNase family protein
MPLIDAHAHLSFFSSEQLDSIFKNAKIKNIQEWILAGYDSLDWQKQKEIQKLNKNVKISFGLHPWRVLEMSAPDIEHELSLLEKLLPEAQGCGETGIDGFRATEKKDLHKQEDVFLKHLELNSQHNLPLVLHIVKSHEMCLSILKKHSFRGIVHGFSGSWETAKNYIDLGYKISLGRGIYQKGFKHLKETALKIGLEDFVLESDAFVTDEGVAEDPVAILYQVLETLAEIKGLPLEKLSAASYENSKSIFG